MCQYGLYTCTRLYTYIVHRRVPSCHCPTVCVIAVYSAWVTGPHIDRAEKLSFLVGCLHNLGAKGC